MSLSLPHSITVASAIVIVMTLPQHLQMIAESSADLESKRPEAERCRGFRVKAADEECLLYYRLGIVMKSRDDVTVRVRIVEAFSP